MPTTDEILRGHGVRPTVQRRAVLDAVRASDRHPTADEVWALVRRRASVSRATVYNTLHLLARRGVLRRQEILVGTIVFDARVEPHHHFVDVETGEIHDIPWGAIRIGGLEALPHVEPESVHVVIRGRWNSPGR